MTAQQERAIARVCAKECMQRELVEALERILGSYQRIKPEFATQSDAEKQAMAVLARAKERQ